jgi:hypothetical protein
MSDPAWVQMKWLASFGRYLAFMLLANLVWEAMQLPLYSLWATATPMELAFAVAHCTLGDILIATVALALSLILLGEPGWPAAGFVRVAVMAMLLGVTYTLFSEWFNVAVLQSWAYSRLMPVIPPLGTGLSPLLQWLVLPGIGLFIAAGGDGRA